MMLSSGVYDYGRHRKWKEELDTFVIEEGSEGLMPRKDKNGYVGLVNQGATCYLNALLQSLYHCQSFREKLYEMNYVEEDTCIPLQLQRLFLKLQGANQSAISTKCLTKSFGWGDADAFEQQDVQEMTRILFDSLEHFENGKMLTKIFQGSLMNYIECHNCGHKRASKEMFQDLSLVVNDVNSVDEAISSFFKAELLVGDNQYFCEYCKKKVDASKGHRLVDVPEVLFLHMKRFIFDWNTERRTKDMRSIEIPLELDLIDAFGPETRKDDTVLRAVSPKALENSISDSLRECLERTCLVETKYTLSAIIIHTGGAQSGHYTSIAKAEDNNWYLFDDSKVTKLEPNQLLEKCKSKGDLAMGGGYMLQYTRVDQIKPGIPQVPSRHLSWIRTNNEKLLAYRQVVKKALNIVKVAVSTSAFYGDDSSRTKIQDEKTIDFEFVKDTATMMDVRNRAYCALVPEKLRNKYPMSNTKIRLMDLDNHIFGPTFDLYDTTPIGQVSGIENKCTLYLDTEGNLVHGNSDITLDDMQIKTFLWDPNECRPRLLIPRCRFSDAGEWRNAPGAVYERNDVYSLLAALSPIVVPDFAEATVGDYKKLVAGRLGISPGDILVIKLNKLTTCIGTTKIDHGYRVLDDETMSLMEANVNNGDGLLITSQTKADWTSQFERTASFFTIHFNQPTNRAQGVTFPYSIHVDPAWTVLRIKELMCTALEIDIETGYHIRKSPKGPQMKDETLSLEAAGVTDQAVLYMGIGHPVPDGHIKLRMVTASGQGDEPNFIDHIFKLDDTIASVKQILVQKTKNSNPIQVREMTPSGPGKVLRDSTALATLVKRGADRAKVHFETGTVDTAANSTICVTVYEIDFSDNHECQILNRMEKAVGKMWNIQQLFDLSSGCIFLAHVAQRTLSSWDANRGMKQLTWFNVKSEKENQQIVTKFPVKLETGSSVLCTKVDISKLDIANYSLELSPGDNAGQSAKPTATKPVPVSTKKFGKEKTAGCKIVVNASAVTSLAVENAPQPSMNGVTLSPESLPEVEHEEHFPKTPAKPNADVPILNLADVANGPSYQDEFFQKESEWSESWREAAKAIERKPSTPPRGNKLEVGARVYAKIESWKRFYPGVVELHNYESGKFTVRFDDGETLDVLENQIRPSKPVGGDKQTMPKEEDKSLPLGQVQKTEHDVCCSDPMRKQELLQNPSVSRASSEPGRPRDSNHSKTTVLPALKGTPRTPREKRQDSARSSGRERSLRQNTTIPIRESSKNAPAVIPDGLPKVEAARRVKTDKRSNCPKLPAI